MAISAACIVMAAGCTNSDSGSDALPGPDERPGTQDDEFDTLPDVPPSDDEAETVEEGYTWSVLASGAGGFVTGFDSTADGSVKLARTDVGGVYRYDEQARRWDQLITYDGVDAPELQDYQIEAMAIAPSDHDRIYLSTGENVDEAVGRILSSRDGGASWTAGAQRFVIRGNGDWRTTGERLAVDPSDPDVVLLGTRSEGLWRSTDGAVSFTRVDSVPVGSNPASVNERADLAGVTWVVFAADGSKVWAGVSGVGVMASSDAGVSWSVLIASEGMPHDAEEAVDGRLWVVQRDPGAVWIVDGDQFEEVSPSKKNIESVTVDPFDPNRAMIGGSGISNDLWITSDGGSGWDDMRVETSCPDIPWLDVYPSDFLPTGSMRFDREVPDRVWVPEGFAVWTGTPEGDNFRLTCETGGIEELVSNDIVVPPGGQPVTAHWDRAIFWHGDDGAASAVVHPAQRFNSAWDLDWAPADPEFLVAVIGDQRGCCRGEPDSFLSGYSEDGGKTWTPFDSYRTGHPETLVYGNIAIAADDTDNLVWAPTFNGPIHVSTDRGASWTPVILPGTVDLLTQKGIYAGGSHTQYFLNRKVLVADRLLPDTFYLYHRFGLFISTDGGFTWELQPSEGLPTGGVGQFNSQLGVSPTTSGRLFYTAGLQQSGAVPFYESSDSGTTWSLVPGMSDVTTFGFGAPMESGGPSVVYLYGTFNDVRGVWRSSDDAATWELVSVAPNGNYQSVKAISGDPDEPGTVFVGFTGTSFMVGRFGPKEGG